MLISLKTCTAVVPSYCFITLAKIELENVRLSVSEILGVFVGTSTADDKYYLRNKKNSLQPIHLQWSKKQKTFCTAYLKPTSNFEHFEKKDDPHRLCIFEIRDCEKCG